MQSADMWLISNTKYFSPERMPMVRQHLESLPEDKVSMLYTLDFKDPTMITAVSALVGEFGVDRFLLGDIGLGVLKMLTLGGCLVWWIIDIFFVGKRARELNFQRFIETINIYRG